VTAAGANTGFRAAMPQTRGHGTPHGG
jgi:hypothetical protein